MRRFQFRLEQLLTVRRYKEREWELKLAKISGICLSIRNRINEIDRLISKSIATLFRPDSIKDNAYLFSSELYMRRLREERIKREDELKKREKEREEVQKEYLKHSRMRKVLEKFKDKQEEEYYSIMKKEEFKIMDNINNGLFIRKIKEEF